VINADEGEPGTFWDRTLMEQDLTRRSRGIIGCHGIGAHVAYIYARTSSTSKERLWGAIRRPSSSATSA
jgi:NADH:ubiquinone oxidoreductase subunit F (NADH-binding)